MRKRSLSECQLPSAKYSNVKRTETIWTPVAFLHFRTFLTLQAWQGANQKPAWSEAEISEYVSLVVQRAGRLCQGWRKHLTLPGPQRPQSFPNGRSMCLSAERSRAHLFYKRSAEKRGALLLCNRVKVGEFKRRKVPSVIPFSVGPCSHHHLLPPGRAGWLPFLLFSDV